MMQLTSPSPSKEVLRPSSRRKRGFTLLELMVTMAILATLFGLGTGLFSSLGASGRGAVGMVRSLLRATREQAVLMQMPSRAELDATRNVAVGLHFADIAQWHFESAPDKDWIADPQGSPPPGAGPYWGFDSGAGVEVSASSVEVMKSGGTPGGYIAFQNGGRMVFPLALKRAFQTDDGFGVALTARLPAAASGRLAMRPRTFDLALTRRGGLTGRIFLATRRRADADPELEPTSSTGAAKGAGEITLKSGPGVIVPDRWSRIELDFDGRVARLVVDGRVVASQVLSAPASVMMNDGTDLLIGEGMSGPWDLDDLTLRRIASIGPVELPEGLSFAELRGDASAATEIAIQFTSDGALDPLFHRRSVKISLLEEENDGRSRKRSFIIGLLGTIQEIFE